MKARVKEIVLDKYVLEILENKKEIIASIKGNTKRKNSIIVGDVVEVNEFYDRNMIEKVYDRKNVLIRPPVANIDCLIIVISIDTPKPDFLLLDKELALCFNKNILPIIAVNKVDLNVTEDTKRDLKYIKKVYGNLGVEIIEVSAKENTGIDRLTKELKNKISAFSGNSGVGKSSIINSIFKDKYKMASTSETSKKTKKGRHTTKYVKIYEKDNMYILDTPGFSSFELYDIEYKNLKNLYPDFKEYDCDYLDCNHVNEDISVCSIKKAVEKGKIDKGRYNRYVELFKKLKEIDDKKYK